ncbi:MAG: hypothetical protein MK312_14660, partial [Roseibacillus sp.]|nr:hypothetical protein [Roseibacillus sp.]
VLGVEERPSPILRRAAQYFPRGSHQPDNKSHSLQDIAIGGPFDNPSAGGNNPMAWASLFELGENSSFKISEVFLAVVLEDFAYGFACSLHDQGVSIQHRISQGAGEITGNRRLSGSHEADQNNIFAWQWLSGGHGVEEVFLNSTP